MSAPEERGQGPVPDEETGHPAPTSDGQALPAVAGRLWKELVCLCGRCERLTLSACRCHDAKVERHNVLELLRGQDLSTPTGTEEAYQSVVRTYVGRFGQRVLASEARHDAAVSETRDWLLFIALITAVAVAIVAFEIARRRWVAPSHRANRHHRRRHS